MHGAHMARADLRSASLQRADLKFAKLLDTDLGEADLEGADLLLADLKGACLWEARGLVTAQVEVAKDWKDAILPKDLLGKDDIPADHNKWVLAKLKKDTADWDRRSSCWQDAEMDEPMESFELPPGSPK